MDKSGEYYLKNIQLQNKKKDNVRKSLNKPQNLENCLNKKDFNKIKKKASKIVTLLPENSLTPIPKKKDVKDNSLANIYDKKELDDAQRTAVFIRRMEYSTSMKRQISEDKNMKTQAKKIALIQEWWKAMFKIIKLQKNVRGFLFRKKLMNNLEHQEKLLQFITEFDNIHSYHLYKQFMDNLKKKWNYENDKLMEKCEDFNDKLDNLEKMHNYKNFKNCFKKWKEDTKRLRKEALDNFINRLNNALIKKEKENKKNVLDKIKLKKIEEEKKLNDTINKFKETQAKKNFFKELKKIHDIIKSNKALKEKLKNNLIKWKNIKDDINKRNKIINKLKKYKEYLINKKKEEEKNKLIISSNLNNLEIISDKKNIDDNTHKKENQIFISPQNEINFLSEPPKKILLSQNYQSFSLIPNDNTKTESNEPLQKSPKLDNNINNQLNNDSELINIEKEEKEQDKEKEKEPNIEDKKNLKDLVIRLDEIYKKARNEIDKEIQKEIIDKLKRKNNLMKLIYKLDDFISKRLKNKAIENMKKNKPEEEKENNKEENNDSELKDIKIIKNFHLLKKYVNTCKLILPNNKNNEDNNLDENKIVILPKKNLLFKIKKEENKENKENKENNINNKSSTKKRIAYRIKTKKTKKKKNKDKKNLKKALDKWKRNSKLIKNKDIFDKYEKKVLQDLFKVCKKIADLSLKKYFDKWKNNENKKNKENKEDNLDEEILKYKKKPKIEYKDDIEEEYEQDTMIEKDSFRPTYILPKQNLYIQVIENPNIDESINENIDSNLINNNINEKAMPYIKKYGQRNFHKKSNSYYNNYNNINPINQYYKIQQEIPQNNQDILNNTQTSENSSEESYLSGVTLIQNNKEIKEPRNYTSQSFFIEKNKSQENIKAIPSNSPNKNEIYKINQIPNMMKGDFENFIEHNPKIFEKKNPRIQVTRSTCDLSNIYNNGIININNDDKYLSKIVKKCDYDLYANQKSKSKKDKWYSMSIPINQLRQGPNYKKINKNEMIEKNENDKIYSNYNSIKPYLLEYNNEKNNYTLQEMNCSQYYRSPIRNVKRSIYGDKFKLNDSVIKIPGKQRRNIHKSLSPFDKNKIKNGN